MKQQKPKDIITQMFENFGISVVDVTPTSSKQKKSMKSVINKNNLKAFIDLNNGVESKELNSNYGESAINKSKELEWDRTVEVKSMNIVFQICDLLETSVDLRQQHNDTMIDFTEGIIKDLLTQQRTELENKFKLKDTKQ